MKTWYSSKIFVNFTDFSCIIFFGSKCPNILPPSPPSNCILLLKSKFYKLEILFVFYKLEILFLLEIKTRITNVEFNKKDWPLEMAKEASLLAKCHLLSITFCPMCYFWQNLAVFEIQGIASIALLNYVCAMFCIFFPAADQTVIWGKLKRVLHGSENFKMLMGA